MGNTYASFIYRLIDAFEARAGLFVACVVLVLTIREFIMEKGKLADCRREIKKSFQQIRSAIIFMKEKRKDRKAAGGDKNSEEDLCQKE